MRLTAGAGTAPIGRVQKRTFREQIVEALRAAIISGEFAPGSQIVESEMADTFGVSRGPLREALRQLIEDGLLVAVPYTGTHVVDLSVSDIHEIFSLRTELEIFAFKQVWNLRDEAFRKGIVRRHEDLLASIRSGDDENSILAELALHSFVYECCGHRMLLGIWNGLRGKLQLYWAAHHRAHGRRGPHPAGHVRYVECALGDSLQDMVAEIRDHMVRGFTQTEEFLLSRGKTPIPGIS